MSIITSRCSSPPPCCCGWLLTLLLLAAKLSVQATYKVGATDGQDSVRGPPFLFSVSTCRDTRVYISLDFLFFSLLFPQLQQHFILALLVRNFH